MKFEIKKQKFPLPRSISDADVKLVEKFAKHLAASVPFIKSVIIDRTKSEKDFIPTLVLIDDLTTHLSRTEIDEYLKKLKKSINKTRLHVETIKFSEFWRLYRHKEPNFLETLREAVVIYDDLESEHATRPRTQSEDVSKSFIRSSWTSQEDQRSDQIGAVACRHERQDSRQEHADRNHEDDLERQHG